MPLMTEHERRAQLRRQVFALCREVGVTDTERHEWFELITGVEGGSLNGGDLGQLRRFIDQLTGAKTLLELALLRHHERADLSPHPVTV